MHGPEHWLGLLWAWLVIGAAVYGIWAVLDVVRAGVAEVAHRLSESR